VSSALAPNTDLVTLPEAESLGALDRKLASTLNDPRDLVFLHLMAQCFVVIAFGIGLFFAGPWLWWLAPLYWVAWGLGVLDRFILMLHCTSHRQLFNRRFRWANQIIPWVIGPFFGETPESYFAHHMGMHHPENNLEADLSSTMKYQRDRFGAWLHYYLSFLFFGLPLLGRYHQKNGNQKLLQRLVLGEGAFWIACVLLAFVNWQATLAVVVGPVVFVRTLMMCGNWAQHAFVDPSAPGDAYKNSITCINTRYNKRCFNDGYHILHHIKPRTHWSEYPEEFEQNRAAYGANDAIVFDGIDFFQVWALLMFGRYESLAARFVQLPGAPVRDRAAVIEFLKSRLRPIAATSAS
jgi:fatty acid desaturase